MGTDGPFMRRLNALFQAKAKWEAKAKAEAEAEKLKRSNPSPAPASAVPTPAEQNRGGWADLPPEILNNIVPMADDGKSFTLGEFNKDSKGFTSVTVPYFRGPQTVGQARRCCKAWKAALPLNLSNELSTGYALQRVPGENRMRLVAAKNLPDKRFLCNLPVKTIHVGKALRSWYYARIPKEAFLSPGGVPYALQSYNIHNNFLVDVVFEPEAHFVGETPILPDYGCPVHSNCVLGIINNDCMRYPDFDGTFTIHEAPAGHKTKDMTETKRKLVERAFRRADLWMSTKRGLRAGETLVVQAAYPGMVCPKCQQLWI